MNDDMTVYRLLKLGETIQAGDEYHGILSWVPTVRTGRTIVGFDIDLYRRKLPEPVAEQKVEEKKFFKYLVNLITGRSNVESINIPVESASIEDARDVAFEMFEMYSVEPDLTPDDVECAVVYKLADEDEVMFERESVKVWKKT